MAEHGQLACPWCGDLFWVPVESDLEPQEMVVDCTVCCRPIEIRVEGGPDGARIVVLE
jgi:hypothetical protein